MTFAFGRTFFGERAGLYGGLAIATSAGMFLFTRTLIPEAIYALEFMAIFYLFLFPPMTACPVRPAALRKGFPAGRQASVA